MSLEATIQENTSVMRELIAALMAGKTAPVDNAAVQAVVAAQTKADAKKPTAGAAKTPDASGVASTSKPAAESASTEPAAAVKVEQVQQAVLALSKLYQDAEVGFTGRDRAVAVLQRFGAGAVTERPGKKPLSPDQYADALDMLTKAIAGEINPVESMSEELV